MLNYFFLTGMNWSKIIQVEVCKESTAVHSLPKRKSEANKNFFFLQNSWNVKVEIKLTSIATKWQALFEEGTSGRESRRCVLGLR